MPAGHEPDRSSPRPGVWAVVPAAGLSRRMGVPKVALPFENTTVLGSVVRTLLDADLDGVVVVTRPELAEPVKLPQDGRVRLELRETDEMLDSIRAGVGALQRPQNGHAEPAPSLKGILVLPGDMPAVTVGTIRACASAFSRNPERIVVAVHAGRGGHPMVFPYELRRHLEGLTDGLRELLARFTDRVLQVEVADRGVTADLDTWRDYTRLRPGPP